MKRLNLGGILAALKSQPNAVKVTWECNHSALDESATLRIERDFHCISITRALTSFGFVTAYLATDCLNGHRSVSVREETKRARMLACAAAILKARQEDRAIIAALDAMVTKEKVAA